MNNLKHSKYKNTGMLFEFLTKQITSDVINNQPSKALRIMETFFNKSTSLFKELELYKILMENKFPKQEQAYELIDKVLNERKKIQAKTLKTEKYNLIKSIRKNYDLDLVFKRNIQNYKEYAAIYKIFEYSDVDNIPLYMINKNTLVEHISTLKSPLTYTEYNELENEDLETKMLVYDIMVERFNTKYADFLPEQKTILKKYLDNFDNKIKLKETLTPDINSTINGINKVVTTLTDDVIKIKVNEVSKLINNMKDVKFLEESHIIGLMKSQELISELKNTK